MHNIILDFINDDSGAAAAEYVLILAIVGSGIAAGAVFLGGQINAALSATGNKISSCSTGTC